MTEVRLEQPEKTELPILVTEFGIEIEVRLEQPEKTELPILVTELRIVTEVRLVQSEYLEVIDYQLFAVNTVEKWIGSYLWVYGK